MEYLHNEIQKHLEILDKNAGVDEQMLRMLECIADNNKEMLPVNNYMNEGRLKLKEYKRGIADAVLNALDGNLCVDNYVFKHMEHQTLYLYIGTHWCKLACNQVFTDFVKKMVQNMGVIEPYNNEPRFIGDVLTIIFYTASHSMKQNVPADEEWMNLLNGKLVINHRDGKVRLCQHEREDYFKRTVMKFIAYCFTKNLKLEKMLPNMIWFATGSKGMLDHRLRHKRPAFMT